MADACAKRNFMGLTPDTASALVREDLDRLASNNNATRASSSTGTAPGADASEALFNPFPQDSPEFTAFADAAVASLRQDGEERAW